MLKTAVLGLLAAFSFSVSVHADPRQIDGMYVNTFGSKENPAVIFVHGGPGHSSWDFEVTTANALAEKGFFVVVYDQRGQGRSAPAPSEDYNYTRYAHDLKRIIDELGLKKPALIGHSHGGPISIRFDQTYPGVARKIVLAAAPVFFLDAIQSIHENCARFLEREGTEADLIQLGHLHQAIFSKTPDFLTYGYAVQGTFVLGSKRCGLYSTKVQSEESNQVRARARGLPRPSNSGELTAMPGFLKYEDYIRFDGTAHVHQNRTRFCGIYGDEDGLFTPSARASIRASLDLDGEPTRYRLLKGASHSLFIDQQTDFFRALRETCSL